MAWIETLVIGMVGGMVVNMKIHAGIYMAPLAIFHLIPNWRRIFPMAAAGLAMLAGPFLSPLFPLSDYLLWFIPKVGTENSWFGFDKLFKNFAFYFAIPLLAGWFKGERRHKIYLAAYVGSVALALYPATKVGAGHYHLLPFFPTLIHLTVLALATSGDRRLLRNGLVAVVTILLIVAWQSERRFFSWMNWTQANEVTAELNEVMRSRPGMPIQMGVGGPWAEEFRLYYWRDMLIFAGHPYTLDAVNNMELTKLGQTLPAAARQRVADCDTRLWLVPRDEMPFVMQGYYLQVIYDDAFRKMFYARHKKVGSTKHFDLWECKPHS